MKIRKFINKIGSRLITEAGDQDKSGTRALIRLLPKACNYPDMKTWIISTRDKEGYIQHSVGRIRSMLSKQPYMYGQRYYEIDSFVFEDMIYQILQIMDPEALIAIRDMFNNRIMGLED